MADAEAGGGGAKPPPPPARAHLGRHFSGVIFGGVMAKRSQGGGGCQLPFLELWDVWMGLALLLTFICLMVGLDKK